MGSPPPIGPRAAVDRTAATFDRRYAYSVMGLLAVLVMVVMYVEGMLTPSLPSIAADFSVTYSQVGLVVSVYLVTGVALSPIIGKLGDIYGKKRLLTAVLAFYTVAVSVTGFSPSFEFMVASRAVQGVGLTVFPLALALVREEFPRDMVPRAQGILSALFGAGFAVSLPLGAWVSNSFGWRATYHSAIPFIAVICIASFLFLRESPYRRPRAWVDFPGAIVLAASLALIVLGLSEGPTWGWTSLPILGMIVAGLALLPPLALLEFGLHHRGREVVLDLRLLAIRNVAVTNLLVAISGFGMFLAMYAMTFRLELPAPVGYHLSIFTTGLSLLPFAAAMLLVAPLASIAVTRTGTKPLVMLGGFVGAGGFLLASLTQSYDQLLGAMFVIGAGLAIMNASVMPLLTLTVEPRDMGLATSMSGVFRNMGSSIGAPLAGTLMTSFTATYVVSVAGHPLAAALPTPAAFHYAFYIAAISFAVAALVTLAAREILGPSARPTGSPTAAPSTTNILGVAPSEAPAALPAGGVAHPERAKG